jgi:hypothetical protein
MTMKVVFCDSRTPVAFAIRFFTWSDWSHCGLLLPDGNVIDSRMGNGGVTKYSLAEFKKGTYKAELREFPAVPDSVIGAIEAEIGKPYDLSAIIGIPFRRDWQENDKWFCSELLAYGAEKVGSPIVQKERWRVVPQDIYQASLPTGIAI